MFASGTYYTAGETPRAPRDPCAVMRKYKPLPLLPVTTEASILAADRTDDDDKSIPVSDVRALVGEQRWVVGLHEVGLKLCEAPRLLILSDADNFAEAGEAVAGELEAGLA